VNDLVAEVTNEQLFIPAVPAQYFLDRFHEPFRLIAERNQMGQAPLGGFLTVGRD